MVFYLVKSIKLFLSLSREIVGNAKTTSYLLNQPLLDNHYKHLRVYAPLRHLLLGATLSLNEYETLSSPLIPKYLKSL